MKKTLLIALALSQLFCLDAPDKSENSSAIALLLVDSDFLASPQRGTAAPANQVKTTVRNGSFLTEVNATSSRHWVYVDLKQGGVAVLADGNWDLRFKRFVIGTNGGTSGTGRGGACDTGLIHFVNVGIATTCLNGTILADTIQSQDGEGFGDVNESANPALFHWYAYTNTILKAKENVYIIQGSDGLSRFKLQMTDYYSRQAGTSGYPTFRWERLR